MDAPTPLEPAAAGVELRQVWPGYDPSKAPVVLSNALAAAATELTRLELRVLLMAISAIHQDDTALPLTAIDLQAYLDVYHPGTTRYTLAGELSGVLERLAEREVTLLGPPERTVPWIDAACSCVVPAAASETGRATLLIRLHPGLTSELTRQQRQFVMLPLADFSRHHSAYSMRLFLLLRARGAWKSINTTILVHDLRRRLGVGDTTYQAWRDFKKRALLVAVKELQEHNQMDIKLHVITRLGRAYKVRFEVKLLPKPLPAGDAESLERWAAETALAFGFHGNLEYYSGALGWPEVAACIHRAQAAIEADASIANPGGYLRTVLESELEARAEADATSEPTPKEERPSLNLSVESDLLLGRYHEERGEFLKRVWEGLPESEREALDKRVAEDIERLHKNKPYASSPVFQGGIRLSLLQETEAAAFPPELVDLRLFVDTHQVLTHLEPQDRDKVIKHAYSSLIES